MRDYGTTNAQPYAAAPAVGAPGDTYYNTANKVLYLCDGSVWNPEPNAVPAGGTQDQLLNKNSATDFDDAWTSIIGANGGISRMVATGNNTFGQIDGQRNNAGAAMPGLQNAFNFRGLGYDGTTYRVLGSIGLGSDVGAVSASNAGGTATINTTQNGTLTNTGRLRIDGAGMVEIASKLKVGQALATAGLTGSALDISNGLLNMRRQAYAVANGFNNDLTLPTSSFIEFTLASGSASVSGFAGGIDGAVINFIYTGALPFSFSHQASSVAANQIYIPTAATLYANGPFAGTLIYSTSLSKWVMTYFSADQFQASGQTVQEKSTFIVGGWGTGSIPNYAIVGNQVAGWGTLTKKYTGTTMVVECGCSSFASAIGSVCSVGVSPTNVSTNVVLVSQFYFNEASSHRAWTGMTTIGSQAAGPYTYTAWVKQTVSAFNTDVNDYFWMKVREVWP